MLQDNTLRNQTSVSLTGRAGSSRAGQRAAREIMLLCTILAGSVVWKYLLELANFHGVTPLIAYNLVASGLDNQVPKPYAERLSRAYNNTLYKNVIFANELTKIMSVFSQHGLAAITLKGTILADQLYENPGLRTVADIDILVRPDELHLADSLLLKMGYKQSASQDEWEHPFHKAPYCKQVQFPLYIELHWDLDDNKLVSVPQQDIWRRAQTLQVQGRTTMVLSPEDTLLFLSNHLTKQEDHLLKTLCDITELLKKYDESLDWDYIVASARSWGIGTAVYYCLRRSKELLGAPVPVTAIGTIKPAAWRRWVFELLLSKESFVSPTKWSKLRSETFVLVRTLMMKYPRQMLAVLSKYRGHEKRATWLRTAIWITLVFGAALGRNLAEFLSGKKSRVSCSGNNVLT
jgi:hypothetical protein